MEYYKSLSGKKRMKKWKKTLIIVLIIVVLILIFLGTIGILRGSNSAERQNISAAVAENIQLKQQIEDLQGEINQLNEELSIARAAVQATPEPSPEAQEDLSTPIQ